MNDFEVTYKEKINSMKPKVLHLEKLTRGKKQLVGSFHIAKQKLRGVQLLLRNISVKEGKLCERIVLLAQNQIHLNMLPIYSL